MSAARTDETSAGSVGEVAGLFLRLGFIAFGGPAAHIAMMRQEIVQRRHWVTDQKFLDLMGAANLIPGPSSTELAIFLGYVRAGWPGLIAAGVCFISPAMAMVLAIAWAYSTYGTTPAAGAMLYGIKPVIIAIVAYALWGLGRTAIKSAALAAISLGVLALYLLGSNPILLLFGAGILLSLARNLSKGLSAPRVAALTPFFGLPATATATATAGAPALAAAAAVPVSLLTLFLTFLKIGAVVYGSGYVLLAFLRDDLINKLGWLTDHQLIDAVAVGQFTPGPVFTTATFIGYIVAGVPGALLSTLAIFLPAFVFTAIVYSLLPKLRASRWTSAFLDGVNVAALGLMAGVTWELGRAAIVDLLTAALALAAGAVLLRFKINSAWLVLAGGAVGVGHFFLGA